MKCPHTPRCDICVACGDSVPEYLDFGPEDPAEPAKRYVVTLENQCKSSVFARSEAEAIDLAVTGAARSARLCSRHVVRALGVEG